MKVLGMLSIAMGRVKRMDRLVRPLALVSGGEEMIQGMHVASAPHITTINLGVRNLAEKCPGPQTNNRAELIVCFWIDFQTPDLTQF